MKITELTELLKGELSEQIATYITTENPFPEAIINSLAEWVLLENIPFNNLISDENLLPNESMRLFYLDKNWTNSLLDGALSIGIHSERDLLLQAAMNQIIRQKTNEKIGDKSSVLMTISGLIIRSSMLRNYKDFELFAFEDVARKERVQILKKVELASDISLVLFETIPQLIEIKRAANNQVLAIVNNQIPLRSIHNPTVGKSIDKVFSLTNSEFRNFKKRVLDISTLQQKIANELGKETLSPSQFAIQLTQSPTIFELVNEKIEIQKSSDLNPEKKLNKDLIFSKLFQ